MLCRAEIHQPTDLGVAAQASGLPPEICKDIKSDLEKAREAIVLSSDLHLTYICVPFMEDVKVDWTKLLKRSENLMVSYFILWNFS